jgi:tyrosinase
LRPPEGITNTRKNAESLTATERGAFVSAILGLKRKPSSLHPSDADRSRYDDFVEVHLNAMMVMMMVNGQPSWGHLAAGFGPWHRVFIRQFELELQQVEAMVSLPYWQWAGSDASSPIWSPDFLGGDGRATDGKVMDGSFASDGGQWPLRVLDRSGDPQYLTRRIGQANDALDLPTAGMVEQAITTVPYDTQPWEDTLRDRNDPAQWRGFRIALEIRLHNLVHRWMGGTMTAMASPNDPVFWLHHCNIDRLWAEWIRRHPEGPFYLPARGGPPGHNLTDTMIFHSDGQPAPWNGTFRPIDVLDHHTLGVRYDTDPPGEEFLLIRVAEALEVAEALGEGFAPIPQPAAAVRHSLPMFPLATEIPALR